MRSGCRRHAGVSRPAIIVAIRFAGAASITIAPGTAVLSDAFALPCPSLTELAVSMHVTTAPPGLTGHPGSRTTSFLRSGDHVVAPSFSNAVRTEHWDILSGLEVTASAGSAAVVVLGNSIADGRGSGTDATYHL